MKNVNLVLALFLINLFSLKTVAQISETEYSDDSSRYVIRTVYPDGMQDFKEYEGEILVTHKTEKNNFGCVRGYYLNGNLSAERFYFNYVTEESFEQIAYKYAIEYYENGDTSTYYQYDSVPNIEKFLDYNGQQFPYLTIKINVNENGTRTSRREYKLIDENTGEEPSGWQIEYFENGNFYYRQLYIFSLDKKVKEAAEIFGGSGNSTRIISEYYFENGKYNHRTEISEDSITNTHYFENGDIQYFQQTSLKYFIKNKGNYQYEIQYLEENGKIQIQRIKVNNLVTNYVNSTIASIEKFNKKNNLVSVKHYNAEGTVILDEKYDKNGNQISAIHYYPNGLTESVFTATSSTFFDNEGKVFFIKKFEENQGFKDRGFFYDYLLKMPVYNGEKEPDTTQTSYFAISTFDTLFFYKAKLLERRQYTTDYYAVQRNDTVMYQKYNYYSRKGTNYGSTIRYYTKISDDFETYDEYKDNQLIEQVVLIDSINGKYIYKKISYEFGKMRYYEYRNYYDSVFMFCGSAYRYSVNGGSDSIIIDKKYNTAFNERLFDYDGSYNIKEKTAKWWHFNAEGILTKYIESFDKEDREKYEKPYYIITDYSENHRTALEYIYLDSTRIYRYSLNGELIYTSLTTSNGPKLEQYFSPTKE